MNEYIKTDVGKYLTNRTGSFEKSPPDELWNNIEKNIPVYPILNSNKALLRYLIGGIGLSVIIIAFILIYYQPFSQSGTRSDLSEIKNIVATKNLNSDQAVNINENKENTIIAPEEKTEKIISTNVNKSSAKQNKAENNTQATANMSSENSITYSINATGLKNVTLISFINENNETVLVSKNPVPNSFGFYIIDISQLPKGTYSIMIATINGTKLHKKETFK